MIKGLKNKIKRLIEEYDRTTDPIASISIPAPVVMRRGIMVGCGAFLLKNALKHFMHKSGVCATLTVLSGRTITYFQVISCVLSVANVLGCTVAIIAGLYLQYKRIEAQHQETRGKS